MSKTKVEKNEFYSRVIQLIGQATKSVHFYSISCCFGFYSFGIKNFEHVLTSIRDRVKLKRLGKYLDVRVMVKIDPDNPMDVFAAERLASLQAKYAHTGEDGRRREIFRELTEPSTIQFLVTDGEHVLASNVQEEEYNEELDLVLNVSQPGMEFEKDDDKDEYKRVDTLFESAWNVAIPLEQKKPRLSRGRLRSILQRYSGIRPANTEREFQLMLMGYLKGQIHPSIIDAEATIVDTRIDLLVGPKPHAQRSGIEVKFKTGDSDVNGIIGQLRNYRQNVEDLVLVVGAPEFSPQGRSRLVAELNAIDVALIELR
ncbi:MAG: hypothetical protein WC712_13085 [Candidatus Brocadiia bacterium]